MKRRVGFIVLGQVQGVGYRWSAQEEALRLGVTGWIRNATSGAVEGEAEGEASAVDAFVAWLQRGPAGARVERCQATDERLDGRFTSFSIRR
jgi:acylphosphatase